MVRIILGLPGNWAKDELESSDHYTTKIGGVPDWPPIPPDALRPELLNCCSCGSKLSLVAQVYSPISTKKLEIEERTLYIFGCLMMPNCGTSEQSWRAFSIQKAIKEKESSGLTDLPLASPPNTASKTHWLDGDDDDDGDFDLESLAKALAEAATTVASSSKKKQKSKPSGNAKAKPSPLKSETTVSEQVKVETGAVVPCFYIYTKEENTSKELDRFSMNYASMSINDREISNNNDSESDEETYEVDKYEYDKSLTADETYHNFKKRLDANPEQCFRYSYGGKPLIATEDLKSPTKCEHCESPMIFEMQLMPPIIPFLHEAVVVDKVLKQSLCNWDWMTVILYTCSKNCKIKGNSDWIVAEECVAVQYEKCTAEQYEGAKEDFDPDNFSKPRILTRKQRRHCQKSEK